MAIQKFSEEIGLLVRARYPLIQLVTWEERRALSILERLASSAHKQCFVWSQTEGMRGPGAKDGADALEALKALEYILKGPDKAFYVLTDMHSALEEPMVVRRLRDVVREVRTSYKTVFLLGPTETIPPELQKDMVILDVPLPSMREIGQVFDRLIERVSGRVRVNPSPELRERLIKAALGLTLDEVENIFAKALVNDRQLDEDDLNLVLFEKEQAIRKSGMLEYYHVDVGLQNVGGLERLKSWVRQRNGSFSEQAREFGLPYPKGLLLLGVQGCGKSLTAKAIAALFRFPLVRLDFGAIFSSYIGSSEANMRKAIKTVEGLSPSVLWIDEIEKGLSGMGGNDSGVTARVIGTFLTWMQEKTEPVFVVATANSIEDLPPELLRKGRFDEIFFVDLPDAMARREILRIHLNKRKRDPEKFNLDQLAQMSEGYSGAELEMAVVDGLFRAWHAQRDLIQEDLVATLGETVPLSVTSAEKIGYLREWARTRAVSAN